MTSAWNMRILLPSILAATVLAVAPSRSQVQKQFANQGVTEIGGTFTFESITPVVNGISGNNYTVLSFSPTIGYFVSDGVEIGADPFGINLISGGGSTTSQISLLFFGAYNFKTENAGFPFIEGLLGYTSASDGSTSNGVTWGFRGGVKVPLAGQALVNIAGQYLQVTLSPSGAANRYGYNQFSVAAGLTIWL